MTSYRTALKRNTVKKCSFSGMAPGSPLPGQAAVLLGYKTVLIFKVNLHTIKTKEKIRTKVL